MSSYFLSLIQIRLITQEDRILWYAKIHSFH